LEGIKTRGYGNEYDVYYLKNKGDTNTPVGIFTSSAGLKMYSTAKRLNVRTGPTVLSPVKIIVNNIVDGKRTQFEIGKNAVAVSKSDKQITMWAECKITSGKKILTGWCCLTYLRPF